MQQAMQETSPFPLEWRISDELVDYEYALNEMEARAAAIHKGEAGELVWLLEHPPLYTAGTSSDISDLKDPDRFPVYDAGRGGQYTYHGPGQRVVYVLLDLTRRTKDVRQFVWGLEELMIRTAAAFGITAGRRTGRVGVWVNRPDKAPGAEDKIGAIGVRVRRWVTFHGIAFNVEPDLEHFSGIVPCGIAEHGVTSLADLGLPVTMDDVDVVIAQVFEELFGKAFRDLPTISETSEAVAEPRIEDHHPVFQL